MPDVKDPPLSRACRSLLGLAVGDAFGETMSVRRMRSRGE